MSLGVEWSPRAERDLLNLPHWRDAERIASAVRVLAATGVGDVARIEHGKLRLRAGRTVAILTREGETLIVWLVYAMT